MGTVVNILCDNLIHCDIHPNTLQQYIFKQLKRHFQHLSSLLFDRHRSINVGLCNVCGALVHLNETLEHKHMLHRSARQRAIISTNELADLIENLIEAVCDLEQQDGNG